MNIKMFKKDVRGAALVYVIVAAAIIVLLGATTTATAYVNLRATEIQEKSDNNFYDADMVMNAIVSGLERDISVAYETAYTEVITNINSYGSKDIAVEAFETAFLTILDEKLNDEEDFSSAYYDISYIQSYAEAVLGDDIQYTITAQNGNNYIDITKDGIVLRNLHVTYENNTGYFDEITTDIKIAIPQFVGQAISEHDSNVKFNAFVIDDGLEIENSKSLQINGDAYINADDDTENAILLQDSSSLTIISPEEAILTGLIETEMDTNLTLKGKSGDNDSNLIWTENIEIGRYSTADIIGQIFVYDDLEVNGSYSEVRLAGEYYGYRKSSDDADESSSININGAHTTLDIQDLDMLVIAGSSYLSASTIDPVAGTSNSTDIEFGEALSVKSNQIAYLVDDKEFTDLEVPGFVSNPMSYAQYEKMTEELNDSWSDVRNKIVAKTLSYGKSYSEYGATVIPVFSNEDEGGAVYLYLSFVNAEQAAKFFNTAYKGNTLLSQRLRTYAAQYITNLRLGEDTDLLVNENYINDDILLYSEENLPTIIDGLGYAEDEDLNQTAMNNVLTQISNQYLDDGTPEGNGEKYKVIYKKLIDSDQLTTFVTRATEAAGYTDHHVENHIQIIGDLDSNSGGVILEGANGAKAVLVDNKDGDPYVLEETGKGIIICSGDLIIKADWLGTIIVGGRAYCQEGIKEAPLDITVDAATVSSVLPLYFNIKQDDETEISMSVLNVFEGYEDYGINNATDDEGIDADMISNCLTFSNWNRY